MLKEAKGNKQQRIEKEEIRLKSQAEMRPAFPIHAQSC